MADVEKDIVLRVKAESEQATGQFKNLKQELRGIENELNRMAESGDTGSKAFQELQKRAGKVKDQLGDTKAAIKSLSSDTFALDAFSQAAQGIAGGFAAAQGAMALFGTENKQVEEAIKKTQGAMALLQGVTAITNILQKQTAFMTGVNTVAQKAYAFAVGTSTGAMKAFRIALATTGILLVVGAIVMAADALGAFSDAEEEAEDKIKKTNEALKERKEVLDENMKTSQSYIDRSIELVKVEEEIKTLGLDKERNYKRINELQKQAIDLQLRQLGVELETKKGLLTTQEEFKLKEQIYRLQQDRNRLEIQFGLDEEARAQRRREQEEKERNERQRIMREREQEAEKYRELEFASIKLTSTLKDQSDENQKDSIAKLKEYNEQLKESTDASIAQTQRVRENEAKAQDEMVRLVASGLGEISKLVGENTKAGKAFAIASTLVDTYQAAQKAYLSQVSIPSPDAPIRANIAAAIAIAQGLLRVKAITNVKVGKNATNSPSAPNGGSGSIPSPSNQAMQTAGLDATQLQLDAQGNLMQQRTMRTYVLETDISAKQQRSKRLQQTATLGK
jgi:hypothetical protein